MLVKTRPWKNTVRIFSDLEAHNEFFGPMRRLVEHVASQPYATLLFSTTSMHALLVAQHAEIEWGTTCSGSSATSTAGPCASRTR